MMELGEHYRDTAKIPMTVTMIVLTIKKVAI